MKALKACDTLAWSTLLVFPHQNVETNPDKRQDWPCQELGYEVSAITSGVKPQMFADSM